MTKEKKKSKWDTTGEGWEEVVVTDSFLRLRGLKKIGPNWYRLINAPVETLADNDVAYTKEDYLKNNKENQ